jgi:hypothetical protein
MEFDSAHLVTLLGRPAADPEVMKSMNALGVKPDLNPERNSWAYATPSLGFGVRFKTVETLSDPILVPPGTFVVASIFFYSPGHRGHVGFPDALPHGLAFEQPRAQVRQALGQPDWSGVTNNNDMWRFENYMLTLDFSQDESYIVLVSAGLPWR